MKNFEGFGLSEKLNRSLGHMGYTTPTPIQAKAIPLALDGRDVLGSAQTGTGKTAAFCIPMIENLINNPENNALILTPTRELAKQVLDVVHQLLGNQKPMNTAFIIGGASMDRQMNQLKAEPRIIVGTPGRINDHLQRKTINLTKSGFLVLDEMDRMLDMGFGVQLDKIIKHLPKQRQALMFSATIPKEIVKISRSYLNNPERISVGNTNVVATNIKQEVIKIEQGDKYKELINQLYDRKGSVIVFIKTKYGADRMAKNLRKDGFTSEALHGDLRQNKRDKVMKNFRDKNFRVLIATDIAARGLDVPHIEHVINYDLPQVPEDYIHRMGRTARAGAEGSAISFVSNQEGRKWRAIELLLNPELKQEKSGGRKYNKSFKGKRSGGSKDSRSKPFKKTPKGKGRPFKEKSSDDKQKNTKKTSLKKKSNNKKGKPAKGKSFKKSFGNNEERNGPNKKRRFNKSGSPGGVKQTNKRSTGKRPKANVR